jgi:hypothetical protein
VVAWKLTVHNDALCELDGSYDACPTNCTRPERDQKRGCPECAVSQMYEQTVEEVGEELEKLARDRGYPDGHKWKWSLDKLMQDVGTISSIDASVDGSGYRGEWPVNVKSMVMILREERASLRRAKLAEKEQEIERERNAAGRRP